jgi:hypothetical protein
MAKNLLVCFTILWLRASNQDQQAGDEENLLHGLVLVKPTVVHPHMLDP